MFKGGGGVGGQGAAGVVEEEDGVGAGAVGVGGDEGFAPLEAHDHVGRGHGVGEPAGVLDDGGAEERVGDGAAGGGVDGVGVFGAVAFVVFAVAAGGDDGLVADGDGGLHHGFAVAVLGRALDAHAPGAAVGFGAAGDDFAADVDEVVVDAATFKEEAHEVGGVALCDGVEVEFGGGVLARQATAVDRHGGVGGLQHGCQLGAVGLAALLEAEAPSLDDAAHTAVEGAAGVVLDEEGVGEQGEEDVVEGVGEVGVDASQQGAVDPEGGRKVEGVEEGVDLRLQVALEGVVVDDGVVGALGLAAEVHGVVRAVGCVAVVGLQVAGGAEDQGEKCYQKASGTGVPDASVFIIYIHYLLTMNLRVARSPLAERMTMV